MDTEQINLHVKIVGNHVIISVNGEKIKEFHCASFNAVDDVRLLTEVINVFAHEGMALSGNFDVVEY